MHRTFPSHALGSKLPPLIGIARMDLGTRLLKAKRNDRGPYTGLHLGPQSDLIYTIFFYFITDWLAVGHIRKKCPFFLTNLRQNAGDTPRYCHKIISSWIKHDNILKALARLSSATPISRSWLPLSITATKGLVFIHTGVIYSLFMLYLRKNVFLYSIQKWRSSGKKKWHTTLATTKTGVSFTCRHWWTTSHNRNRPHVLHY